MRTNFQEAQTLDFQGIFRGRTTGKQCKCEHTCQFHRAVGPVKLLVGEPPQTRRFGTRRHKLHYVRFGTFCPKAHLVPLRLLSPHSPQRWACAGAP